MRRFLGVIFIAGLLACATSAPVFFLPATATAQYQRNPNNIVVWVDTQYGYYHCPGTKWYGATRQGVYMTQGQAQYRGYRPAYGWVCR